MPIITINNCIRANGYTSFSQLLQDFDSEENITHFIKIHGYTYYTFNDDGEMLLHDGNGVQHHTGCFKENNDHPHQPVRKYVIASGNTVDDTPITFYVNGDKNPDTKEYEGGEEVNAVIENGEYRVEFTEQEIDAIYILGGKQNIKTFNIVADVQKWQTATFSGCTNLESTNIELAVIPASFYRGCPIKEYDFSNVQLVNGSAFAYTGIKEIILPDDVEFTGASNFSGTTECEYLYIPRNVITTTRAFNSMGNDDFVVFDESQEFMNSTSTYSNVTCIMKDIPNKVPSLQNADMYKKIYLAVDAMPVYNSITTPDEMYVPAPENTYLTFANGLFIEVPNEQLLAHTLYIRLDEAKYATIAHGEVTTFNGQSYKKIEGKTHTRFIFNNMPITQETNNMFVCYEDDTKVNFLTKYYMLFNI